MSEREDYSIEHSPQPKLTMGDHQESEFINNIHNEENIREKLARRVPSK